ncbi:MAG: hypothetical protein QGG00_05625 [Verrucomicrobiota bacterium]|jgi:hypothetical protein|nr:hypothetical protein [Verrucomicrobiota bacterium]
MLCACLSAQTQDAELENEELDQQIAAIEKELMEEISVWDFSTNLRLGGGYKENVTLSAFAEESSPFYATGLDFMAIRVPLAEDGVEVAVYGALDDRRYLDAESVDREQTGLINVNLEKPLAEGWSIETDIRVIYIDEIFDASLTEDDIGTVQVVGKQISLEPALRRDLPGNTWIEVKPEVTRQYFAEPLDDFLEVGGRVSAGVDYGYQSELSLHVETLQRDYDTRSQRDEIGFYMPDTDLGYDRPEHGVEWTHYWDSERRIRMRTRWSILENDDSGSGYFDYRRERVSHGWRFRGDAWSLAATVRKSTYAYDLQRSTDFLRLRQRADLSCDISISYEYNDQLTFQLGFDQESINSNVPQDEYRYRVYTAGVDWEF